MKKNKFTDRQIMAAIKRAEVGMAVPQVCRELGISSATFYKSGAPGTAVRDTSMIARMKELEDESRRLRKRCMDEKLKAQIVDQALTTK